MKWVLIIFFSTSDGVKEDRLVFDNQAICIKIGEAWIRTEQIGEHKDYKCQKINY